MKYIQYLRYVMRHRWFVFVECCKLGIPWRGLIHDLSKFLPSEFFAYAEAFYGEFGYKFNRAKYKIDFGDGIQSTGIEALTKYEQAMNNFDLAWLLHQKRNPHHWQFWLNIEEDKVRMLDMPEVYIKEMVADWCGASRAITGKNDTKSWYASHISKIRISNMTRQRVEQLLEL